MQVIERDLSIFGNHEAIEQYLEWLGFAHDEACRMAAAVLGDDKPF